MTHKVLVLVSHPNLSDSRINDALASAAETVPSVTVRHIDEALKAHNGHFNIPAEHALLEEHSSIILQFPWYWYAPPATTKQYLDEILTRGWAYAGGSALANKNLLCAISTGGTADAYSPDGSNGYDMDTLLAPLKATAQMTKLEWLEPFIVHGARHITEEQLSDICDEYKEVLSSLTH